MLFKILFVLGLLLVLAVLVYSMLRPVIKLVRQFVQTVRHFQKVGVKEPAARSGAERLLQCATCNTWIPQSRALAASAASYCSQDCLKRARVTQRRKRVS